MNNIFGNLYSCRASANLVQLSGTSIVGQSYFHFTPPLTRLAPKRTDLVPYDYTCVDSHTCTLIRCKVQIRNRNKLYIYEHTDTAT